MSWRQAARNGSRPRTAMSARRLMRNLHHLAWLELREEGSRPLGIELGIRGLDQEKELVLAGKLEARRVEDRMIRLREPVEHQHPDHGEERAEQNRRLKGWRNV